MVLNHIFCDINHPEYKNLMHDLNISFSCEELPNPNCINQRGSRYLHAFFDKNSGNFIHCDGAIRIYSENEIYKRLNHELKSNEVRKIGKRIKLFRIEGNIPKEKFISILSSFFYWNYDLIKYINSKC